MIKTKQKIFLILVVIFLGIGIAWYLNVYRLRNTGTPEKFIASIEPVRFLVKRIVGEDFKVATLLPAGSSPETYEPTSRQIVETSSAKAIFTTGLIDFENIVVDKISANSSSQTVNLSLGVNLIPGSCSSENSDHSHAGHGHGIDPHIWMSPKTLKIMAQNAYEAISTLYPDSTNYQNNYNELLRELDDADRKIRSKIAISRLNYFIIYHPALSYYSVDYNLTQIALEQDGKEPSVAYLTPIIDKARMDSVRAILYQKHLSPSVVESIAKDIGARPVEFDPMAADVIGNLLWVTDVITL